MEKLIVVTNDDGIHSIGLFTLVKKLSRMGKVIVVAPDRQQSTVGYLLTIANPL